MIIGVYGTIGAGKTTISNKIKKLKFKVINADKISKDVLNSRDIEKQIKDAFPNAFIENNLNRAKLRKIISEDQNCLNKLNSIVWPEIKNQISLLIQTNPGNIVIDAALLPELGLKVDKYIRVKANLLTTLLRVKKRDKKPFKETYSIYKQQKQRIKKYDLNNEVIIINDIWTKSITYKQLHKKIFK
ncbi:dephospho-CoA kinase [Mesoplasma florum]|uniref:dephospho-CoA kinase n=1 Tax=Mesoplasma florum TaxID=2151 RepID=UPI000BE44BB8|nr:dephospho-CoA kinase [Mesoplasma florum]ATI73239.1 dephospho-CoA kinase [Mesoplasma florum]AVN61641.1 dephospho-CoA kinase [Mesoplasma florum]